MPPSARTSKKRRGGRRAAPAPAGDMLARLRRTIFALCREREIGEDLRHEIQESVTGKASLTECTVGDMRAIIARVSGQNVWTAEGMMNKLAGEIDNGRARLRAFCWKRFNREPGDLDRTQTRSAIAFLKNVKKKENPPDGG